MIISKHLKYLFQRTLDTTFPILSLFIIVVDKNHLKISINKQLSTSKCFLRR